MKVNALSLPLRGYFYEKSESKKPLKILPVPSKREQKGGLESLLEAILKHPLVWVEGSKRAAMAQRFVEENYPHVAKRLEGFRRVGSPEGQDNAIGKAFDQAYDALYTIAQMAWGRNIRLAEPYTFGTPDDGVQYEWRRGERQFHLEIIPSNGEVRYGYLLWPSRNIDDGEEGEFTEPLDESVVIKEFLQWVEKGWL